MRPERRRTLSSSKDEEAVHKDILDGMLGQPWHKVHDAWALKIG